MGREKEEEEEKKVHKEKKESRTIKTCKQTETQELVCLNIPPFPDKHTRDI